MAGAPKVRTMEAIDRLEDGAPRGLVGKPGLGSAQRCGGPQRRDPHRCRHRGPGDLRELRCHRGAVRPGGTTPAPKDRQPC